MKGITTMLGQHYNQRRIERLQAQADDAWSAEWQRALDNSEARVQATDAGRQAQIAVLKRALAEFAPDHPSLRPTGRSFTSGALELSYQKPFFDAYDAVADQHGIEHVEQPMTPRDAAYAAFVRTWCWRGQEYRSAAGAERARKEAAQAAAEAVDKA